MSLTLTEPMPERPRGAPRPEAEDRLLAALQRLSGRYSLQACTRDVLVKEAGMTSLELERRYGRKRDPQALLEAVMTSICDDLESACASFVVNIDGMRNRSRDSTLRQLLDAYRRYGESLALLSEIAGRDPFAATLLGNVLSRARSMRAVAQLVWEFTRREDTGSAPDETHAAETTTVWFGA